MAIEHYSTKGERQKWTSISALNHCKFEGMGSSLFFSRASIQKEFVLPYRSFLSLYFLISKQSVKKLIFILQLKLHNNLLLVRRQSMISFFFCNTNGYSLTLFLRVGFRTSFSILPCINKIVTWNHQHDIVNYPGNVNMNILSFFF